LDFYTGLNCRGDIAGGKKKGPTRRPAPLDYFFFAAFFAAFLGAAFLAAFLVAMVVDSPALYYVTTSEKVKQKNAEMFFPKNCPARH
jgi:hypothetical protein